MSTKPLNQQGAMSFLTVIFLSILLTIVTLSFVRISVNEQRQAVDDDLTNRAFYAAESGVEDARQALADYLSLPNPTPTDLAALNGSVCAPADGYSGVLDVANLETEYTCQLIELTPSDWKGSLAKWEGVTIPLDGVSAFDRIRISWHIPDDDGSARARNPADTNWLPVPEWVTVEEFPASLRTSVIPVTSGFNGDTVTSATRTGFINPAIAPPSASASVSSPSFDTGIHNGSCPASSPTGGSYVCSIELTNLPAGELYLHLQSLYRNTHVQVQLLDSIGTVPIENTQAVIDVTGRAGDVFRRLEVRVSLAGTSTPLPDVALWSNTDICKAFTVTDDPADYDTTACPSWQP